MKKEIWKPVVNFESLYEVSNLGRVYSIRTDKILKPRIHDSHKNGDGYHRVHLCVNGKKYDYFVHRLVAEAFIPNPYGYTQINHRDEDKTNNDVSNLEWCDCNYNCNYGTRNIRIKETRRENTRMRIGTDVAFKISIA